MTKQIEPKDYQFIVFDGSRVPKDAAARTTVRKQAMKDVGAARRRDAVKSRVFLGQVAGADEDTIAPNGTSLEKSSHRSSGIIPELDSRSNDGCLAVPRAISVLQTTITASSTGTDAYSRASQLPRPTAPSLCSPLSIRSNPTHGYTTLRAKYDIDLTHLSPLTSFHICRSTISALSNNPNLLHTLLGGNDQANSSYMTLIPARYGHKPYLDAVIDCMAAKVRSTLTPCNADAAPRVIRLYTRALRAIAKAIPDKEASCDPDLLCAVQMLSMYEIFQSTHPSTFRHHINGSADLIRHRSPANFNTRYEQELFLAHIGPASSEAFYNGETCYLAQPEWISLYASLARETTELTDRSPLVIRIRKAILRSSGLVLDTTRALSVDGQQDADSLLMLELQLREIHQDVLECVHEYDARVRSQRESSCASGKEGPRSTKDAVSAIGRETFVSAIECLCIFKRALASLSEPDRMRLESECQVLADLILRSHGALEESSQAWVYVGIEKRMAQIVKRTRGAWEEDVEWMNVGEQRVASRRRWKAFREYVTRVEGGA